MTVSTQAHITQRLDERLGVLQRVLMDNDFSSLNFGPLNYLKHELQRGGLRGIKLGAKFPESNAMDYTMPIRLTPKDTIGSV